MAKLVTSPTTPEFELTCLRPVAEAIELTATGAVEDKRRAFAETRLMSRGAKAVQEAPSASQSGGSVWATCALVTLSSIHLHRQLGEGFSCD